MEPCLIRTPFNSVLTSTATRASADRGVEILPFEHRDLRGDRKSGNRDPHGIFRRADDDSQSRACRGRVPADPPAVCATRVWSGVRRVGHSAGRWRLGADLDLRFGSGRSDRRLYLRAGALTTHDFVTCVTWLLLFGASISRFAEGMVLLLRGQSRQKSYEAIPLRDCDRVDAFRCAGASRRIIPELRRQG